MKEPRDHKKKQRQEKQRSQLFNVIISLWQNKVFCFEIQHGVTLSVIKINTSHHFPYSLRAKML